MPLEVQPLSGVDARNAEPPELVGAADDPNHCVTYFLEMRMYCGLLLTQPVLPDASLICSQLPLSADENELLALLQTADGGAGRVGLLAEVQPIDEHENRLACVCRGRRRRGVDSR